jgi:hypothetical protein
MDEDIPLPVDLPAAALKLARCRVSRLQTDNDRFESARIQGRANGEGPLTIHLSRSRRVSRMAGALALLGRLSSAHVDGHVMQASEKPAQEELFPPSGLTAGYGFRKETIAGVRHNGRDAPIPAIRRLTPRTAGGRPESRRSRMRARRLIPCPRCCTHRPAAVSRCARCPRGIVNLADPGHLFRPPLA